MTVQQQAHKDYLLDQYKQAIKDRQFVRALKLSRLIDKASQ